MVFSGEVDTDEYSDNGDVDVSDQKMSNGLHPLSFRDCLLKINEIYEVVQIYYFKIYF